MAQINIRMDDKLRVDGERLFKELGLSFSSAVSLFVSQAVREREIPFKISTKKTPDAITLASERVLAKDWLLPEEDEAWVNL